MSPRSRGRPPGRGRSRQPGSRPAARRVSPGFPAWPEFEQGADATDCWFDEPGSADRRSWAIPPGHGSYHDIDVELLDPDDDDELMILVEALHEEYHDALDSDEDLVMDGEPVNPRLHVAMHHVVARQILADDPPQAWQTVQRLAGLGYDWHNIMHMIAKLVAEDINGVMTGRQQYDPASYAQRLDQLPGDWPAPGEVR